MNKAESDDFNDSLTGNIGGGIGVELGLRNDVVTVLRVLKDNPAEGAGVRVGDVIVGVNGDTYDGWTVQETAERIRGEEGTTVKVTVLRGGETKDFRITRDTISNPSVYGSVEDDIGIMTITRFDGETGGLARQLAQTFADRKVRGVVLDLRGNGGGYVTAAQEVASLWLDNKIVVTERANGQVVDELRSGSRPILKGIKTVVLVNESSASASEIVAGALQDHGAATLVGATTFGKGSVQKLLSLPGGAELKVTIARWYTPEGRNIGEQGITPDVSAELTVEDINAGRDPQLDAAKEQLE
jgi:carboxyl-terminal processing protease